MLTVHDRALLSGVVPSSLLGTCSPRQALIALGNMTPVDTIATAAVHDPSADTNPITVDLDFAAAVFAAACEGRLD